MEEVVMTSRIRKSCIILDSLCWLVEDAFEGDPSQSLLGNLVNIRKGDWETLPAGGGRTIANILMHVGWCKWMDENYAFGNASMRGDQPPLIPAGGTSSRPHDELLTWLKEGHDKWLASVRALPDDTELERERLTNWSEHLPTRTSIRMMIGHD
jgi:hypothetical protein